MSGGDDWDGWWGMLSVARSNEAGMLSVCLDGRLRMSHVEEVSLNWRGSKMTRWGLEKKEADWAWWEIWIGMASRL